MTDLRTLMPVTRNPKVEEFRSGDTVRVNLKVIEGNRERTQTLEGVVIRQHRGGAGATFTIRRVTRGVGMELTYLVNSPRLETVQVVRRGRVRRARLYYLRGLFGKAARIKGERVAQRGMAAAVADDAAPEATEAEAVAAEAEAQPPPEAPTAAAPASGA
ncbi:MAG: 50S ribosomal protein L19 [Chloroflexi bacterium]|nr:50S ribosomal protein L19 [Chloroflexota bacterium]